MISSNPFLNPEISAEEKLYLKAEAEVDKFPMLMFLRFKKQVGNLNFEKLTRPKIFKEAFKMGMEARIRMDEAKEIEHDPEITRP